uniref:Peptidase S1 domain-containing protein n=1 Tax=Anopheles culicifacies TaxID=139723 RepID=A0A182M3B2_9DIPT
MCSVLCRLRIPAFHNDIALVKLKSTIQYNDVVQPIAYSERELPENATLTLTGWGLLSATGPKTNKLQTIDLKYVPYEECKRLHDNSPNVDIGHVCTLTKKGEGACNVSISCPLHLDLDHPAKVVIHFRVILVDRWCMKESSLVW